LVDTMELGYADASARHAALADVPMTPQFGPSKYRDFQLADHFVAAGREAASKFLKRFAPLFRDAATQKISTPRSLPPPAHSLALPAENPTVLPACSSGAFCFAAARTPPATAGGRRDRESD